MDKEVEVYIHNRIYSAIKRNTFESVLMRWLNLEPIIPTKSNVFLVLALCVLGRKD